MSIIRAFVIAADVDRQIPFGIRCEITGADGKVRGHRHVFQTFDELHTLEIVSGIRSVELTAFHEMEKAEQAAERWGWKLL